MDEHQASEDEEGKGSAPWAGPRYGWGMTWVDGLSISAHDCPECLERSDYDCTLCEYFSPSNCLLRSRPNYISNLRIVFDQYRQRQLAADRQREKQEQLALAVLSELRAHGRPLHYRVLTRIVADRYPTLAVTARRVLLVLSSSPNRFEKLRGGVYALRRTSET